MSKVWHCAKKTATYFLLIQVTAHWKFGAPLTLVRWIMQKVEKVEGGGWESIVYIVILIATYFQEEAGQIWGCEGQRHSTVWDAKGSHVAQLGVKTPTKMIVINQATDQQISSTVISSPPNPPTPFWGWARGGDARKVTDELFFWPGGSYTWRNLPCQHRVARLHPGDHLFYNSIFSIYPGHSLGQLVHPIQSVCPLTVRGERIIRYSNIIRILEAEY